MNSKWHQILSRLISLCICTVFITIIVIGCAMVNDTSSLSSPGAIDRTQYSNPVMCLDFNSEEYASLTENPFRVVAAYPLSTFSIDVDAASYTNCRRYINDGSLPPQGSVRIEEFVNYFKYTYPQPAGNAPIGAFTEISNCPWNTTHQLAKIGIKAKEISNSELPPANLTFLLDVSGSMADYNKLPFVKDAFKLLVEKVREQDKVAIVTYSNTITVALPPTSGINKSTIIQVIDKLTAGGSTAGGQGIQTAYSVAEEMYSLKANNRVILATDGDFNVGISSESELINLIKQKRDNGIYLTVLGFGMGNIKDNKMEALADNGNGNYAYIDELAEAQRVFLDEFGGTLFTIAKDVKIQVEFNPAIVKGYRLIGYENRMLSNSDFNTDTTDAGEMGAGQTVTAFYELITTASSAPIPGVDSLRYQSTTPAPVSVNSEYMFVKIRYKDPADSVSKLITYPVGQECFTLEPSSDFLFATSVVEAGLLLRPSQFKGTASFNHVLSVAEQNTGTDPDGYRAEFAVLMRKAYALQKGIGE